jgi:hypothetical protein
VTLNWTDAAQSSKAVTIRQGNSVEEGAVYMLSGFLFLMQQLAAMATAIAPAADFFSP